MPKKFSPVSTLRTLDPLYGYGWDIYPKSTLLVLIDALACDRVEPWFDAMHQLEPQMMKNWPPSWVVDEIVDSPELVEEFGASIRELVTWGEGVHWRTAEQLPPLLPTTRWLSELMRFKIGQDDGYHRNEPSLILVANDHDTSPGEQYPYIEQLDVPSVYYGFDLHPKSIAVALLDWEIYGRLCFWYETMKASVLDEDFNQETERWPMSAYELIPHIVDKIAIAFRSRFEWAIRNEYLSLNGVVGFDDYRQREQLMKALEMRISRWPDFFGPIQRAIAQRSVEAVR